jgi:FixJ family two-component response regulator
MRNAAPTVVVIDDEDSVRKALVRLLRSADLQAVSFSSVRAFLADFESLEMDCLVIDLQMPDMTGLDLQRYMRMVRPDVTVPVVIITAHDEPGTRERCYAAGVSAYLPKPVGAVALLGEIDRVTGRARRTA